MALTATLTKNLTVLTLDGATTSGVTWDLDQQRLLQGWFGAPATTLVTYPRQGASGSVIASNVEQGMAVTLAGWAVCTNQTAMWTAINLLRDVFGCVDGTTATLAVTLDATTESLVVERVGELIISPKWPGGVSSPANVVIGFEAPLLSTAAAVT